MTAAPPFAVKTLAAPPRLDDRPAVARSMPPRLAIVDRGVLALTLLTAASLIFGAHGAHPPAPRELGPIVIVTALR